jgi:tight adherence protein B
LKIFMVSQTAILLIVGCLVLVLASAAVFYLLRTGSSSGSMASSSLRGSVDDYRQEVQELDNGHEQAGASFAKGKDANWQQAVGNEPERVKAEALRTRLRYANLPWMPPYVVALMQILISLLAFAGAYVYLGTMLRVVAAFTGPLLVNWWIDRRIKKRVKKFDADFAQFLLSVVGMLKTGLNPIQALEAAAESLEDDSLVRQEVALMLERVRMGVPEDRSIGSFGEDIDQPEIELFVQALLLSRRVGGTLSETLDRLAKQIRKRQVFKTAAIGAVSTQRGSIFAIIGVIALVQLYMFFSAPAMVVGAWTNPKLSGWAQGAVVIVIFAIWVIGRMTKVKI